MSERILNDIRLYRSQSLRELRKAQLCITIKVKTTHNRRQFLFNGLVADSFEETTDRKLVYDLVVVEVDGLESTSDAETLKLLQILLQLLKSQFEINFFGQ